MQESLWPLRLNARHAATAVAVIASVYFSISQLHNQKMREQRDLESSSSLLADGLREAVEPLLGKKDRLQEVADRFGKRGHLTGIAVFSEKGELVAKSAGLHGLPNLPPSTGYRKIGDRRLRVDSVALERDGKPAGTLAVLHDPAFLEKREEQTRMQNLKRMLIQAGVFLVAVGIFGWFLR